MKGEQITIYKFWIKSFNYYYIGATRKPKVRYWQHCVNLQKALLYCRNSELPKPYPWSFILPARQMLNGVRHGRLKTLLSLDGVRERTTFKIIKTVTSVQDAIMAEQYYLRKYCYRHNCLNRRRDSHLCREVNLT